MIFQTFPFAGHRWRLRTRSIVVPLSSQIHLAFDAELIRTRVVWKGPGLNLYGSVFEETPSERYICDFDSEEAWTTPPIFPWSVGSLSGDDSAETPPWAKFRGIDSEDGRVGLCYELNLPGGLTVRIRETPWNIKAGDFENVVVRRFEISARDQDLWLLAHAEFEGKFDQPHSDPRVTVIKREADHLLAVLLMGWV